MDKLVIGILAHVDAGKTTLSEAMLYTSGSIRKLGRVDNRDAFLDTYSLERTRGITIFSKQATLKLGETQVTLLDTPGHVDFSAEMERTLRVLDYAVLVISGADGIQGHTGTLWRLLLQYQIPVFLFVNKMDQEGTDKAALLTEFKSKLHEGCLDFTTQLSEEFYESIAMCDEDMLESYLAEGKVTCNQIRRLIQRRKCFPCFFGSALKLDGVESLLQGLESYMEMPDYPVDFGARVFKIARDDTDNRLTYMKITGGSLKVREMITFGPEDVQKVNQIRIYSGEKFEAVNEVCAGEVCAVTGLTKSYPGQGLGIEGASGSPVLKPVLTYQIVLPEDCAMALFLPKLRQLEEEQPELHIVWDEQLKEIQAQLMGEVQMGVLKHLIHERFGIEVAFGEGHIVYKETIANTVEGVGHFEPLRHYAEVHLILSPGAPGSGLIFETDLSEDDLDRNWQRLILTHLEEKEHRGVLTGARVTDMKLTLAAGRAHQKHTEGGDFRQATYRAVRHGLMCARSVLLEPYYTFRLEVPEIAIGRAIADMDRLCAVIDPPLAENGTAVLTGSAPAATMRGYPARVTAYTKGLGRLLLTFKDYEPCHNAQEVIEAAGYDALSDLDNPSGSVFCAHGAGFNVPWNEVTAYMHLEPVLKMEPDHKDNEADQAGKKESYSSDEVWMDTQEVDAILNRTFYANRREKNLPRHGYTRQTREYHPPEAHMRKPEKKRDNYLLVDGYNIIYAWEELRGIVEDNIDGARLRLMDILCNYQAIRQNHLIVVFDAYKAAGNTAHMEEYKNIHVVYTKEAETADQYIEKFAHENALKYQITVATSDGLEQIIIRSQGCALLSARELYAEVMSAGEQIQQTYLEKQPAERNFMLDSLDEETLRHLTDISNDQEQEDHV